MTNKLDYFTKVKQLVHDGKFPTTNDMLLAFEEMSSFIEDLLKTVEELTGKIDQIESDREARLKAALQRLDLHLALLNTFQTLMLEKNFCTKEDLDRHFQETIQFMRDAAENAMKQKEQESTDSGDTSS